MSAEATTASVDATQVSASAAAAPNLNDWRRSDGSINHDAFKALPEDIRHVGETLGKYKTDVDLFRGIAHLQTLGGKKGLIPLPADAPKEVMAERKALLDSINGVPKEPKDYGITRPKDFPEAAWDQALADNYSAWAHKWSVGPGAAKEVIQMQQEAVTKQMANQAQWEQQFFSDQQKAFESQIRTEGIGADKANALVERGLMKSGVDMNNPETKLLMKNATFRLMAMRHAIATGEDSAPNGEVSGGREGDPAQLASDASHNKANPLYEPLYNTSHPQHKMVSEKVAGWWREAAARGSRK